MEMGLSRSEAGRLGAYASQKTHAARYRRLRSNYEASPNICPWCQQTLPYESRRNRFCSQSCSISFSNTARARAPTDAPHVSTKTKCRSTLEDDVLAGRASARRVKRYLISQHGQRCMDPACAWDFECRLVNVELDHVDGDSSNNALDNVRLLCPNCHSLTPTYKNRNAGQGRAYRRERYAAGKSY